MALLGYCKRGRRSPQIGALAALALGAAEVLAFAADGPPPISIAVFPFELEDLSPSAVLLKKPADSATTMEKVSSAAREELAHSGRYTVVDASRVDAKPIADKTLRDCNGCEAGLAQQLGAQQSLIGLVRKVTETDYYVVVRIRDAGTGKILDQEEAMFAGDETGWATGVRMLIKHQVLPTRN
jgi:Protein of unknown function (DUF2380)